MHVPRSSAPDRRSVLLGCALGLACFAYLLTLPPTLGCADESSTLYGAKRIFQGEALYRDFFDFITPGSFYLYALAYAVGGVSITTARVTTALLQALAAVCVYVLSLRVASMAEALLAGLLAVVICVPVWNAASHHWIATSMGLASAATLLSARFADSTRLRPAAAGALAGMLVCTHQGRGFWFLLWLAATVPGIALARGGTERWRRGVREVTWTAIGGAALCIPVLGYALWRSSFSEMSYATYTWVVENYRTFHAGRTGWSGYQFTWADGVDFTYLWLFQWLPAILAVEAASLLWAVRRDGPGAHVVRAALLLLAVCSAASILYFPDVIHVAFVAPFSLIVMAGMAYRARLVLAGVWSPVTTWGLRLVFAGVLAAVLFKGWSNARLLWQRNPVLFATPFGTIAAGEPLVRVASQLRARLGSGDGAPPRMFAYQADAWLYLTLPADNPTPFALLRPALSSPRQIQQAIDHLDRDPEARVVVNILTEEPGDPFLEYLRQHYRDVAGFGPVWKGTPIYRLYERSSRG